MLLILFLGVVLIVSGLLLLDNGYEGFGELFFGLGMVVCLVIVFCWPTNYFCTVSNIKKYEAVKLTIIDARKENISEIERAALTTKIIEMNEWLANQKYWRKSIFKDSIPKEIDKLEYLK